MWKQERKEGKEERKEERKGGGRGEREGGRKSWTHEIGVSSTYINSEIPRVV